MAHSCDLSTRYTKEVAEKGSIDPCRSCKRQGGATGMLSLLVSYPPHLASFRLLLWACQAVPRPVCGYCRALCPRCAICLEPNRDDNPGARCRQPGQHTRRRTRTDPRHAWEIR